MDTLYMNLFDSSTSMGWVNATISSVQAFGNVALVHTVEEIGERLLPQTSSVSYITKKPTPLPPGMVSGCKFFYVYCYYDRIYTSPYLTCTWTDPAEGSGDHRAASMQQPVAHRMPPCSAYVEQPVHKRSACDNIFQRRRSAPRSSPESSNRASKARSTHCEPV